MKSCSTLAGRGGASGRAGQAGAPPTTRNSTKPLLSPSYKFEGEKR
jgi:hypothetical protein